MLIFVGISFKGYCAEEPDSEEELKEEETPTIYELRKQTNEDLMKTRYNDFIAEREKLNRQRQREGLSPEATPTYEEWSVGRSDVREKTKEYKKEHRSAPGRVKTKEERKAYYKDTR